jgi:hypothetical protein
MNTVSFARQALLFSALTTLAGSSFGATVTLTLDSSAAETTNNSSRPTQNLDPNPLWATALNGSHWISNTQSGNPSDPGYFSPPNGTDVVFSDKFTLNGTPTGGSIKVMADDTAAVFLNGVPLEAFAPTQGNTYFVCSDFTIGCSSATTGTISITAAELHTGVNVLSFEVLQTHEVSYGLDYSGTVGYTTPSCTPTPEPGTLALLGLPLVSLGVIARKRKA